MRQRSFFLTNPNKQPMNENLLTIGIVGVTMDETLTCINKIHESRHRPNILMHQQNFGPIEKARWDHIENSLIESIKTLVKGGANFVIIPANIEHEFIENIKKRVAVPIISMLDVVAAECHRLHWKKVGVLGAEHLYQKQLANIEKVTLSQEEKDLVQKAILEILMPAGIVRPQMFDALLNVVRSLKERGCEGIILACPKLSLVLNKENCRVLPTLDTIALLAEKAVQQAATLSSLCEDHGLQARL